MKKIYKFPIRMLMLMALLLLTAACGGSEEPEPAEVVEESAATEVEESAEEPAEEDVLTEEPTEEPTTIPTEEPTVAPTEEPTPEPTAVPTEEPTPEPAEVAIPSDFATFENNETGFSIGHPADWNAESVFGFTLITSDSDVDMMSIEQMESGAIAMVIGGPLDEMPAGTLSENLDTMAQDAASEAEEFVIVDGPNTTTINSLDAATMSVEMINPENQVPLQMYFAAVQDQTHAVVFVGTTTQEESEIYLPTLEAMAQTIVLYEPTEESAMDALLDDVTDETTDETNTNGETTDETGSETSPPATADTTPVIDDLRLIGLISVGSNASAEWLAAESVGFSFSGTAGQLVDVEAIPTTDGTDLTLNILDPNGQSVLINGAVDYTTSQHGEGVYAVRLPLDGDYTIQVNDFFGDAGSADIYLSEAGRGSAAALRDIAPISVGDEENYTFPTSENGGLRAMAIPVDLSAGATIDITATPEEGDLDLSIEVINGRGDSLTYSVIDLYYDAETISGLFIPDAGTYTIVVRPYSTDNGQSNFTLNVSTSSENAMLDIVDWIAQASPLAPNLAADGQLEAGAVDYWLVPGTEGQIIDVVVSSAEDTDLTINIYGPSGFSLIGWDEDGSLTDEELRGIRLPAAGAYVVTVTGYDEIVEGAYTITAGDDVPATIFSDSSIEETESAEVTGPTSGVVTIGAEQQGGVLADQDSRWTFDATAGETLNVVVQPMGELDLTLSIVDSTGESITDGLIDYGFDGELEEASVSIPADGTYTIVIAGFAGAAGDYTLTVTK